LLKLFFIYYGVICLNIIFLSSYRDYNIGDWGIGDWGLGIGDWAQSPIPNPQSPIPNPQSPINFDNKKFILNIEWLNKSKIFFLYNKLLSIFNKKLLVI
jgi:hypothetical protein